MGHPSGVGRGKAVVERQRQKQIPLLRCGMTTKRATAETAEEEAADTAAAVRSWHSL